MDGKFERFQKALFQDFVGVLRVWEEDAAFQNCISQFLLQKSPALLYTMQTVWHVGRGHEV
jgi:hypothetical protein